MKLLAQQQRTEGDCSPNVGSAQGNVTVICNFGDLYKGGIYLYEEPVEIYWNDWWAFPFRQFGPSAAPSNISVTVFAEGKTKEFVGVLDMNCENGRYRWIVAANFDRPLDVGRIDEEMVPTPVVRNIWRFFCRR